MEWNDVRNLVVMEVVELAVDVGLDDDNDDGDIVESFPCWATEERLEKNMVQREPIDNKSQKLDDDNTWIMKFIISIATG